VASYRNFHVEAAGSTPELTEVLSAEDLRRTADLGQAIKRPTSPQTQIGTAPARPAEPGTSITSTTSPTQPAESRTGTDPTHPTGTQPDAAGSHTASDADLDAMEEAMSPQDDANDRQPDTDLQMRSEVQERDDL
jgi:hypothetical protein